ncbi:MAG: thiamine-binding protein [Clostridia bacterium]|nr:thiamine-binding protein [Clostridia bacterium]
MNASIGIQVVPKATGDDEVIRIVDEVIDYIRSTGLNYFVGPLETSVEGDFDQLMDVVKNCQTVAARAGAKAISTYVKINYRPDGEVLTIEKKVSKHHK